MVVPLSGTSIRLLSGVPFSNDYKHTRWFDTKSEQTTHFLARPRIQSIEQVNFQKIEGRHFFASNANINELWNANYFMFKNPSSHIDKWFYAFVTELEYINRSCTHVYFEIDVLQTWMFDMQFKPSYIVREHCDLYKADGTPIVNTVDEGLDYGTEYDIVSAEHFNPPNDLYYLVIVTKSLLHSEGGATPNTIKSSIIGVPQPLCYYIHPIRRDGTSPNVSIGGSNLNITSMSTLLSNIYSQDDAVDNIVSLYITEHIGYTPTGGSGFDFDSSKFSKAMIADGTNENIDTIYVKEMKEFLPYVIDCGKKYDHFKTVRESKLLMYPYCVTILEDFKGNRYEIKNEYLDSQNINVSVRGSLGTSNKVAYTLGAYSTGQTDLTSLEKARISLGSGMINTNPQDISIISDMLSAFLQGNRNSIENQQNSIMWNGVMDAIGGAVGGATSGGGVGAVSGAVGGVISGAGNTVLQLQGIQAKQKDINNTPPSLVKMGGNISFDFGNGYTGFYIIKKQIKNEYIKKLSDFFMMYGYKVNEVKVPNFHTRQSFNYVQTASCHIVGNFNNEDMQKLKSIFDNGITLWHVNDVGNYALENGVR